MGQQVCAPWAAPEDLCCEGGGTIDDCVDGPVALDFKWSDTQVIEAASNILYARTGFRWPGECQAQVWPCVDDCHSSAHPCVRCCSLSSIQLPTDYPVVSVDSITEDGVVLSPNAYRLERGNVVTRLDGLRWQRNTFGLDVAGVETIVTFTAGSAPPIEGRMAAAALACELKKSCNGDDCALPANVTSFARRGVSVELTDLAEMLKSGATGIPIVDHFLGVWEPWAGAPTMSDPASRYRGQQVT